MNTKRTCWFCDKPLPPDAPINGYCPHCNTPYQFDWDKPIPYYGAKINERKEGKNEGRENSNEKSEL